MASVGLYDIDFNHGQTFSLSLPLMKAYGKLSKEGHIVKMMKPYENTGRYNRVFYFKESQIKIPDTLTIDTDKGKMVGYGFYGKTDLLEGTALTPPDFTPYDMNIERIKNKSLYRSIKQNSIVDWREKDFTGASAGAGITYVNDRNFMGEIDWEELFDYFNNNIYFIHALYPDSVQLPRLIKKDYISARIVVPIRFEEDLVKELLETRGIVFENEGVDNRILLMFILFCKTFSDERIIFRLPRTTDETTKRILKWGSSKYQGSYVDFCKQEIGYLPVDNFHFNFKPKSALYQNPKAMTPKQFKAEYLKQLT